MEKSLSGFTFVLGRVDSNSNNSLLPSTGSAIACSKRRPEYLDVDVHVYRKEASTD
jgi:hypothetical protein